MIVRALVLASVLLGCRGEDERNKPRSESAQPIAAIAARTEYAEAESKSVQPTNNDGRSPANDDVPSITEYQISARQGLASAQYALGNMYCDGEGVSQDREECAKWFVID